MSRLVLFNMVSADGFFADDSSGIDWHTVDDDFDTFSVEQLDSADGLVFGRVTYQLMESYWPTTEAAQDDPVIAGKMNSLPKVVCSRTLDRADWHNTTLISRDITAEIAELKQQSSKDLLIFGSANLASTLIHDGLIDEYRLMVAPVVLGSGRALFTGANGQRGLRLLKATAFRSGNVLLSYEPAIS